MMSILSSSHSSQDRDALALNARSGARLAGVRRVLASALAVLALLLAMAPAASATANNVDSRGRVSPVVDALVLRPMGLIATGTGLGMFLLTVPFVAITRPTEISLPFKWLVMKPIRYTWIDPLGDHPATGS